MIGDNIRALREYHGLKVEEFARIIGTGPGTLESIEAGRRSPSFDLITRICVDFHIMPGKLTAGCC